MLDGKELWRQIPPEEKIELLSRANSAGFMAALMLVLTGATFAVGLQMKWFLWGSLIVSPLVFQIVAGRAWRALKPSVMLSYLGARSAARRFAFIAKSKELTLRLLFRGEIEEQFISEDVESQLEEAIGSIRHATVWVALFEDAVVMLSERPGGAEAEFAHPITDTLHVESRSTDGKDYSSKKELVIRYSSKLVGDRQITLRSKYPAALIVFEKALLDRIEQAKQRRLAQKELESNLQASSNDL